jgi:hypothetical protein
VRRACVIPAACLLVLAALLTGCGNGVRGHGTGPAMSDLLVPLDGNAVPGASGPFDLDRYVRDYAAVPDQERAEFTGAGFVDGWLLSTLDDTFGRRLYLIRFRDPAAAREVYGWYRGFVKQPTFTIDLAREHYGRVDTYQDDQDRNGTYVQVLYPAGPFLVVISVTVATAADTAKAKAEATRIATAESTRLP